MVSLGEGEHRFGNEEVGVAVVRRSREVPYVRVLRGIVRKAGEISAHLNKKKNGGARIDHKRADWEKSGVLDVQANGRAEIKFELPEQRRKSLAREVQNNHD